MTETAEKNEDQEDTKSPPKIRTTGFWPNPVLLEQAFAEIMEDKQYLHECLTFESRLFPNG